MELYCIDSRLNAARHIKQLSTIRSTLHETHIFPHMLPILGDSETRRHGQSRGQDLMVVGSMLRSIGAVQPPTNKQGVYQTLHLVSSSTHCKNRSLISTANVSRSGSLVGFYGQELSELIKPQ